MNEYPVLTQETNLEHTILIKLLKDNSLSCIFIRGIIHRSCTFQACDLRDSYDELSQIPVLVLGVSSCPLASHQKFKTKYSLPYPLLLDEDHAIAELFGVWGEKKFMGKTFDGIHRTSFIISKSGEILKTYLKVKPKNHLQQVMQDLIDFNAK